MKFLIGLLLSISIMIPSVYSAEILGCNWEDDQPKDDKTLFYVNEVFTEISGPSGSTSGEVISSPLSINKDSNYKKSLVCDSSLNEPGDSLNFYSSTDETCGGDQVLLHLTSDSNALVSTYYNSSEDEQTLCAELPTTISSIDIEVSKDNNYENIGYDCLFRVSANESGRISSCDAEFNSGDKYEYTVWGRAFQSLSSLSCNSNCVSEEDNRIRNACSQKLATCKNVPDKCDGSLLNSWVDYNNTHQIKCSKPWDEYRLNPSDDNGLIDVESDDETCSNLISTQYSVMLNNEPTLMKVYTCNN